MVYETEQAGTDTLITRNGKKYTTFTLKMGGYIAAQQTVDLLNDAHGKAIADYINGLPEDVRIMVFNAQIEAAGIDLEAVETPAQSEA